MLRTIVDSRYKDEKKRKEERGWEWENVREEKEELNTNLFAIAKSNCITLRFSFFVV